MTKPGGRNNNICNFTEINLRTNQVYFLFRYESHCKGSNDGGETWKGKDYIHMLIKCDSIIYLKQWIGADRSHLNHTYCND